jgi:hypothetical protein
LRDDALPAEMRGVRDSFLSHPSLSFVFFLVGFDLFLAAIKGSLLLFLHTGGSLPASCKLRRRCPDKKKGKKKGDSPQNVRARKHTHTHTPLSTSLPPLVKRKREGEERRKRWVWMQITCTAPAFDDVKAPTNDNNQKTKKNSYSQRKTDSTKQNGATFTAEAKRRRHKRKIR